jgi:hypothetical protein
MAGLFVVVVTWFTTFLFVCVPALASGYAIGRLRIGTIWATVLSGMLAFAGPYLWMTEHIGDPLSDRDHSFFIFGSTAIFAALFIGYY